MPDEKQLRLCQLGQAMLRLKPKYQTVITLRYFEHMKTEELAQVLGCSQATARSRISRAVKQLQKQMSDLEKQTVEDIESC
jgi:RNA polymerase sigma factor (sigma-70 family)